MGWPVSNNNCGGNISSLRVVYEGPELSTLGIHRCDRLENIIGEIDKFLSNFKELDTGELGIDPIVSFSLDIGNAEYVLKLKSGKVFRTKVLEPNPVEKFEMGEAERDYIITLQDGTVLKAPIKNDNFIKSFILDKETNEYVITLKGGQEFKVPLLRDKFVKDFTLDRVKKEYVITFEDWTKLTAPIPNENFIKTFSLDKKNKIYKILLADGTLLKAPVDDDNFIRSFDLDKENHEYKIVLKDGTTFKAELSPDEEIKQFEWKEGKDTDDYKIVLKGGKEYKTFVPLRNSIVVSQKEFEAIPKNNYRRGVWYCIKGYRDTALGVVDLWVLGGTLGVQALALFVSNEETGVGILNDGKDLKLGWDKINFQTNEVRGQEAIKHYMFHRPKIKNSVIDNSKVTGTRGSAENIIISGGSELDLGVAVSSRSYRPPEPVAKIYNSTIAMGSKLVLGNTSLYDISNSTFNASTINQKGTSFLNIKGNMFTNSTFLVKENTSQDISFEGNVLTNATVEASATTEALAIKDNVYIGATTFEVAEDQVGQVFIKK